MSECSSAFILRSQKLHINKAQVLLNLPSDEKRLRCLPFGGVYCPAACIMGASVAPLPALWGRLLPHYLLYGGVYCSAVCVTGASIAPLYALWGRLLPRCLPYGGAY